jgi:hypothetical protein
MVRSECRELFYRMLGTCVAAFLLAYLSADRVCGQDAKLDKTIYLSIHADIHGMKSDQRLALLPWEVFSARFKNLVGVDPFSGAEFDMELATREEGEGIAAIRWTGSHEISVSDLSSRRFLKVKDAEGAMREDIRHLVDSEIFIQKLEQVWYLGTMSALTGYAEAKQLPTPGATDRNGSSPAYLTVSLHLGVIRDELSQRLDAEWVLDEDVRTTLANLIERLEQIHVELLPGRPVELNVILTAKEGTDTATIVEMVRALQMPTVNYLQEAIGRRESAFRLSQREQFAWEAYCARLKQSLLEAQPTVQGQTVSYRLKSLVNVPLMTIAGMGVLETFEMSRLSNDRFGSQYKLRELHEAIEKYIEAKGSFPLREILSEQGDSLLSWRVAMLPYLGYESLYNKFHLNEPWDSPHNIALLKEMPSIYRTSNPKIPEGYTAFVAPYGWTSKNRKTVWDIVPSNLDELLVDRDPLLLVEVEPEGAVPWSSPEDINVMQTDLRTLLRSPPEGNGYLDLDGDTDFVSNAISTLELIELLNCSTEGER